jgi:hypothetical protein
MSADHVGKTFEAIGLCAYEHQYRVQIYDGKTKSDYRNPLKDAHDSPHFLIFFAFGQPFVGRFFANAFPSRDSQSPLSFRRSGFGPVRFFSGFIPHVV